MKKTPGKKEISVGLDIGSRLIKAVEVLKEGNTYRLVRYDSAENELSQSEDKVASILKSFLDSAHLSSRDVNISFSAPHAVVRFINMPKMKEDDLKNSLRYEAEKYIPFNVKEVMTDAAILGYSDDKRQMRVLFAAVKRKIIDSRVNMLKNLGYAVKLVDIDSFACLNAFSNVYGDIDESKTTALLNIGHTHTNLIILHGSAPRFTRDIQIGTKDMAKYISAKVGVNAEEADRLIGDSGNKGQETLEASKPALNSLVDELRLSFGYYENQYGKNVNEAYLSGGVSRLEGVSKHFEDNFGIKTEKWNPFAKFELSQELKDKNKNLISPQFAVSAGLALR